MRGDQQGRCKNRPYVVQRDDRRKQSEIQHVCVDLPGMTSQRRVENDRLPDQRLGSPDPGIPTA